MEIENNQVQPEPQRPVCQPTEEKAPVISVGEWMVTLLILFIPIVNIIMLFIWGFGGGVNKTKANYCKASLIFQYCRGNVGGYELTIGTKEPANR